MEMETGQIVYRGRKMMRQRDKL